MIQPSIILLAAFVTLRSAAAGLEALSPEWDFASGECGATLTNAFEIRNTANTPLTVGNVRSSCQCTTIDFPKEPVSSGSSAWVRVALHMPAEEGPVNKRVTVEWQSAAGAKGETVLVLKGNARALVWIEPSAANFGICRTGAVTEVVLVPRSHHGTAVVVRVTSDEGGFVAEAAADRRSVRVRADTATAGTRRGLIHVEASDGTATRVLNVPVYAHVQRPMAVFPERASVGSVGASAVMLRTAFGEPFQVLSCTAPDGVSAKPERLTSTSWSLVLRKTPGATPPGSCLVVKTDLASSPEICVPVEVR